MAPDPSASAPPADPPAEPTPARPVVPPPAAGPADIGAVPATPESRVAQPRADKDPWALLMTGDGLAWVVIALTLLVSAGCVLIAFVGPPSSNIDIVAGLDQQKDQGTLRGRVVKDGQPIKNATVWAVAKDSKGNRDSPPSAKTNDDGAFEIKGLSARIERLGEVAVFARETGWFADKAEEVLTIGSDVLRRSRGSSWLFVFIPFTFVASAILPFLGDMKLWKYVWLLVFAVWVTASVIAALSISLKVVQTQTDKDEIVSMGFASLFRGRYVEDVGVEWLLSLTAPAAEQGSPAVAPANLPAAPTAAPATPAQPEAAKGEPPKPPAAGAPAPAAPAGQPAATVAKSTTPLKGFGAPLWVVLLAVVGSGLMTVSLIVAEISDRPDFPDPPPPGAPDADQKAYQAAQKTVQQRAERIVRHQFFILFSPLSAIFVYQALVAANTASQPLAVAITVLGAGPVLNGLLDKALTTAQGLMSTSKPVEP